MSRTPSEQLSLLVAHRERYFVRMQQCFDLVGKEKKTGEFVVRAEQADDVYQKFENCVDQIVILNSKLSAEERVESGESSMKSFEDMYYRVKAHLSSLKEHSLPTVSQGSSQTSVQSESNVKLPTISIPIFDGDITSFLSWKSLFDELVHNSSTLSDIQKFSYLKSYLKGSALASIESVSFSASNYPLAYRILKERFLKKRLLANNYLNKLLKFSPLAKDSLAGLQSFLDSFYVSVESLRNLNIEKLDEFILLQLALRVLDSKTCLEFESEQTAEFPKFEDLIKFVKNKCTILEVNAESSHNISYHSTPKQKVVNSKSFITNVESVKKSLATSRHQQCAFCGNDHKIYACEKFHKLDTPKRFSTVKDLKLCFSCLNNNHSAAECKSVYKCKTCGSSNHHTLIHPLNKQVSVVASGGPASQSGKSNPIQPHVGFSGVSGLSKLVNNNHLQNNSVINNSNSVLLGTAVVEVQDINGFWHLVRCVIDPGSQISIISNRLCQILKLTRKFSNMILSGIGLATAPVKGEVTFSVRSRTKETILSVHAVILQKIAANITSSVNKQVLDRFKHLQLADESYLGDSSADSSIDLLLGAEYFTTILLTSLPIIHGMPSALPTVFGWVLLGKIQEETEAAQIPYTSLFVSEDNLSESLQRFWELEEVTEPNPLNPEDEYVEQHFLKTVSRDENGRYSVGLPFRKPDVDLGSNRDVALRRLLSLERKLAKNVDMKNLYHENLQTYITSDHMEVASHPSPYLLIHHGVFKESSTTTKLRVVFNPNVKGSSGNSLSDLLLAGPKLQADIGDLLISFRLNPVALICDIQGMYRSIWLNKEDRLYQHILWRPDLGGDIKEFELKTVTFGLPSSPFQALRVIKQLMIDEGSKFPRAAAVGSNSVYVDDVVTGGRDIQDTQRLRDELIHLFRAGGFTLRKWASSHAEVLSDLPLELCEQPHQLGCTESIKVLGIQWSPTSDSFFYTGSRLLHHPITKRQVLSCVASIYDPNGYLAPVTIWMKIFMQKLWLNKGVSWDSEVPEDLLTQWDAFFSQIPELENIQISRYVLGTDVKYTELVVLCDASIVAYAAVAYLRVTLENGTILVNLIRAKTKVAPLKVETIPRLELRAAVLAAKLVKSLSFLIAHLLIKNIYLFSDSTTVLTWLKTEPHRLKTFVANRVAQIIDLTGTSQWRYVPSELNSADPASRGLVPSCLVHNNFWFHGPTFLKNNVSEWPAEVKDKETVILELRPTVVHLCTSNDLISCFQKFSSLVKLERVWALVLRFVYNLKAGKNGRRYGFITVPELRDARLCCIKISQSIYFDQEIKAVQNGSPCAKGFLGLSPIMNSDGLLAVGGRLSRSPLPEAAKHPVLLSRKCHLTKLIVEFYHLSSIHGGPKLIQSWLQRNYWIIGARSFIRKIIHQCISCFRVNKKCVQPYMADLPSSRFSQGRPFINVGVDLAGYFLLKSGPRRNSPIEKAYIAVFICMTTKCVHLELLTSLSVPAFLGALDRFIGRRGLPSCIHSDNATNFRGSYNYLCEVQSFLSNSEESICNHLSKKSISWSFIPPGAPNFGGLWEAGVKSVKIHLKHVLHERPFNYEEFYTLLVSIEAILNSRPLCATSSSPNDGTDVLTPGHFLIGAPLLARPEPDISDTNPSLLSRWKLVAHSVQCFWHRFRTDVINTMIQRSKWTKKCDNVKVNDVVLVQGQNLPCQKWPLGVVTRVCPGEDGVVRVAVVKTVSCELKRPVSKLAVLPFNKE